MANQLLTIGMITREAVRIWKNTNSFIKNIDTQYDDSFAKTGAKIGSTLRIRLPNDYTIRRGPVAQVQDTTEVFTSLTVNNQIGVDVSFSSFDRTMSLDDFSRRVLAPMVNNLTGHVAADIMSGVEGGISNFTGNVLGDGTLSNPVAQTWLNAVALLDQFSSPSTRKLAILDPTTMARTVSSLAGLFNPQNQIGDNYREAMVIGKSLGIDEWYKDQTVLKHTTGNYSGSLTVNGAGQTGISLVTNAIAGGLAVGDIFIIAGVNSVNRITKQPSGLPQQFVVTAAAAPGATQLQIYPAIIPYAVVGGNNVEQQYQTVDNSPANGATITIVSPANSVYRKNFVFVSEAVTMATADLDLPQGVHEVARESYDGISIRMISAYNPMTDQFITRTDVLYGYRWVRPEWAVVVGDAV